jgi:hypothetical protein
MNWYRRILAASTASKQAGWMDSVGKGKLFDEVRPEDYEDWHTFNTAQYFSIGQRGKDAPGGRGMCWSIPGYGKGVRVSKGGTHAINFGPQSVTGWRGWYDPHQQLVSVVIPLAMRKKKRRPRLSDVPQWILNVLQKRFPGRWTLKVF